MTGEMVGRDEEPSAVHAFLDRPVEGLRALVLEGEAGIGKSTLPLRYTTPRVAHARAAITNGALGSRARQASRSSAARFASRLAT
jgi:predicted ATP-dependent serine protease